jgi:hypothetical protein
MLLALDANIGDVGRNINQILFLLLSTQAVDPLSLMSLDMR